MQQKENAHDVALTEVRRVPPHVHARYSATGRCTFGHSIQRNRQVHFWSLAGCNTCVAEARWMAHVPGTFGHSLTWSLAGRTYYYRIVVGAAAPSIFERGLVWHVPAPLNINLMQASAPPLNINLMQASGPST
eukprot:9490831-Pyramimonas_sp.AAC.1